MIECSDVRIIIHSSVRRNSLDKNVFELLKTRIESKMYVI